MALRMFRQSIAGDEIIQLAVRLVLIALLAYWSFVLIRPFIPILIWSMVLAVSLYPPYDWLSLHLGNRPKLAAATTTGVTLAIIVGPVTWLGSGLVDGLQSIAGHLSAGTLTIPAPPEGVKGWPIVGGQIYTLWDYASTNLRAALRELAPHLKPLASLVLAFAGSAGLGALKFVAAVALSGFLFHYGPRLVTTTKMIQTRLVTQRSQDFVALAGLTIRTVANGVIGVAVLQAMLAGIGLKLAGVPHAGLLAFAVLILAVLQIGSAVVLIPVMIWIWATKDFAAALPLIIYLLIVGFADNVVKPILMGRGLSTPTLVIFIGVLGGMLAHGILGLFVGPIVLAVTWELARAWIREERAELAGPDMEQGTEALAAKA
ncbi:Predicted PurR-regulated permease PerM [Bradyrhizobium erythrophlei]|jgi:predicted PurR-regulated permease PerM|uniref:Predicted PurR-regulated permease PerM n=2 Tax=Bradyrhizobium erythrophlei TaxID=1437360 RepID=A0A1M7UC43_9BRAD|nr:Predicted PurR-regulated permease PerM [Bradyrhizobium erythrophlei]